MPSSINSTSSSPGGIVTTGAVDNALSIQTGDTTAVSIDSSQVVTFNNPIVVGTNAINAENSLGFRNRLINSDMRIDQRNAGAEVNPAVNATYYLDRWVVGQLVSGKFKIGQNAGSVTPPAGFTNYLGCTSLSAYSVGAGDYLGVSQKIEGFNVADLGWGTANAKTVTLSFKVYSSLTGTFSGSILNSALNRSYIFAYSITSANTWTDVSVTIVGDTTGTWLTTSGTGIEVYFNLGSGSGYNTTAGSWTGLGFRGVTGGISVVGTNGATWYITGVQLEVGSVATPFERRPYGMELSLCQRYFQTFTKPVLRGVASGVSSLNRLAMPTLVTMRAAPTLVISGTLDWYDGSGSGTLTTQSSSYSTISSIEIDATAATGATASTRPVVTYVGGNTGTITASAEL